MASSRSRRFLVTDVGPEGAARRPDDLLVEEPLTVVLDGTTVTTTMRTPGNDFELAVGFCFAEGLITSAPASMRYCGAGRSASETDFNRVEVVSGSDLGPVPERLGVTSSSCGWCGSEQIDQLVERLAPLPPTAAIDAASVARAVDAVRDHQELFERTGASHAAASFDANGQIGDVREDVGRHNAVDKVVGARLMAGRLPALGEGLFVSGRASTELVQKAWAAGFSTLVAVSAPTALAVEAARRSNLQLIGFARGQHMKVYSPERLA